MEELLSLGKNEKQSFVFSSGGPIAVMVGNTLNLSDEKTLHLSWVLYNSSITELQIQSEGCRLKSFNRIPHLHQDELITIV